MSLNAMKVSHSSQSRPIQVIQIRSYLLAGIQTAGGSRDPVPIISQPDCRFCLKGECKLSAGRMASRIQDMTMNT